MRPARFVATLAEHFELRHVELADHRVVAERGVERARSFERLGVAGLELPRLLVVPQRAIDAAEELVPQHGCAPVMRCAPRDQLRLLAVAGALRELGQLGLDDLCGSRRIVGLDDLDQPIRCALVGGVELERGPQVLDRGRGLAEHRHRFAGFRPRVGCTMRIAFVLSPRRAALRAAHRGRHRAAPDGAQRIRAPPVAAGMT